MRNHRRRTSLYTNRKLEHRNRNTFMRTRTRRNDSLKQLNNETEGSNKLHSKSSSHEVIQSVTSIIALVLTVVSLFLSLQAIITVSTIVARDDATSFLIDGEAAFQSGDYKTAYKKFSSALLYDSAIAKAYLGYMNSNQLGCESRNVWLGSQQYKEAIEMGYTACKSNLLYNTVKYSTCYYEIADALLAAYESGDVNATVFMYLLIKKPPHIQPFFDNSERALIGSSDYYCYLAQCCVNQFLSDKKDRQQEIVSLLTNSIDQNNSYNFTVTSYAFTDFPQTTCAHDFCTEQYPNLFVSSTKTHISKGISYITVTLSRNSFNYIEYLLDLPPSIMQNAVPSFKTP